MSGRPSELSDLLGPFTGIPNRTFQLLPHLGHKAFILYFCLRYHAGKDETVFPSYDLINAETGLHRRDISKAIRVLESFELIERKRRFSNSTVYKILYLMPEDVRAILEKYGDPVKVLKDKKKLISSTVGTNDSSNGGISSSSNGGTLTRLIEQDSPDNKTQIAAEIGGAGGRSDAVKLGDWVDCALRFSGNGKPDTSNFPEDVRPVIDHYCDLYTQLPPRKTNKRGGEFALWIDDARGLLAAGGNITLDAMTSVHDDPFEWMKSAMIGRPGALIKAVRNRAGELRETQQRQAERANQPEPAEQPEPEYQPEINVSVYRKIDGSDRTPQDVWQFIASQAANDKGVSQAARRHIISTVLVDYAADGVFAIWAPDLKARDWLEARFTAIACRGLQGFVGMGATVKFICDQFQEYKRQ